MREKKKVDLNIERNDVALLNKVNICNTNTKYKTTGFILSRTYINN